MMGKQSGKKKKNAGPKPVDSNVKQSKKGESSARKAYDKDTAVFIAVSQELKEEGNKLFQKRDHEGAMLNYEKALNLLPSNHVDVSYLHSNIAACYMQKGLVEYPKAIHECNLALETTPNYTKALLKRARCYEALNRLDLALRDGNMVLKIDPRNLMASEIVERVKTRIEKKGSEGNEEAVNLIPVPEYFEPPLDSPLIKSSKEKLQKKKKKKKKIEKNGKDENEEKNGDLSTEEKRHEEQIEEKKFKGENEEKKDGISTEEMKCEEQIEEKKVEDENEEKKAEISTEEKKCEEQIGEKKVEDENEEKKAEISTEEKKCDQQIEKKKSEDRMEEKRDEDKLVVEDKISNIVEEESKRTVKLVFGEDIRRAKIPVNCSILELREIIHDRFPSSKAVLIKYRDQEGDLVTITTDEELRWAESSAKQHGSIRLFVVEVNPDQDPFYEKVKWEEEETRSLDVVQNFITENGNGRKFQENEGGPPCIDDWIIQFAQLFMNNVGFNSDGYLDIHELGMKLYSEAMEETVTSEEAQELFETAANKFQEMAALALFNWGNVHMSRARKRVYFKDDASKESVLEQVKIAYEWAQKEYAKAGKRYEEALNIKPDFYEGVVALGTQQFEQAKLSWYYAIATNVDLEEWASAEAIRLYNSAEENMEKGMQMWELIEEQRLNELSRPSKVTQFLEKMDLGDLIEDLSAEEAAERTANMRSMINVLWGTMLYERSMMEYKLGLPIWQECLEVAIEKFELAGASPTDIAVMIKNHCSNGTALKGLGFNIDEIVQAWNEMYEAKRWQRGVPSFRLEPLLKRRVSKLYHALEHA